MKSIVPGIYTHYKGKKYEVLGIATHEADLEPVVMYKLLYTTPDFPYGSVFIRPLKEFTEVVEYNGKTTPRFQKISSSPIFAPKDILSLAWFPFVVFMANEIIDRLWHTQMVALGLDSYLHFFGGLSIAYCTHYTIRLLQKNNILIIKSRLLQTLQIVAVVALAAVLWEAWEFWHDLTYGTQYQPSNFDTMKDLILGITGALTYCLTLLFKKPAA